MFWKPHKNPLSFNIVPLYRLHWLNEKNFIIYAELQTQSRTITSPMRRYKVMMRERHLPASVNVVLQQADYGPEQVICVFICSTVTLLNENGKLEAVLEDHECLWPGKNLGHCCFISCLLQTSLSFAFSKMQNVYHPDANVHLFNVNETAEDKNNCAWQTENEICRRATNMARGR